MICFVVEIQVHHILNSDFYLLIYVFPIPGSISWTQ